VEKVDVNPIGSSDSMFTKPPIIIGGCGRSGTSLLLSVLSAHPHIYAIPHETKAFCPTAYTAYKNGLDLRSPFDVERIKEHLSTAEMVPTAHRWCEKTPKNILFFGRILKHFGDNVRLLNVIRDGRDVILSRHPYSAKYHWVSVHRWVNDVKAGLPFDFHPQVLVVKYENLVNRFEQTVTEICRFLDEEMDSALLNWHKHATVQKHLAWHGKVDKIYGSSVRKWKFPQYKDRVASLMSDADAVGLLQHYGYLDWEARPWGNWRMKAILKRIKRIVPQPLRRRIIEMFPFIEGRI
jgi:hypothetical protein